MYFRRAILLATIPAALAWGGRVAAQPALMPFTPYACHHTSADQVVHLLRPLLPASPPYQLVVDRDQNRILVSGPEQIQIVVQRMLSEIDRPGAPPSPSPVVADLPMGANRRPPGPGGTGRFLYVPPKQMTRVEQQLYVLFDQQLRVHRIENREIILLATLGQRPIQLEIEFDSMRSGMLIGGPPHATQQLVILVQALAHDSRTSGFRTQVFRVHRKNHESLKKIVNPLRPTRPLLPSSRNVPYDAHGQTGYDTFDTDQVKVAGYLLQDQDPSLEQPDASSLHPPGDEEPSEATVRQFEGVEIESLPDLDVIILRGRGQDLEQLAEIIRQLERVSRETQAEVRIVALRHVHSQAIAEIITQTSSDLISGRQGRASVTPLVKPNALLVIGWGAAVEAVVQLIQQLDKPVAPESQSAVFQLRNASAAAVRETLDAFFDNREGLGPRVEFSVDARTNAIIVYASPRDLEEVRKLIQDLDRPGSGAVNRARIIRVENALSADVAATLQQAIAAASGGPDRFAILELQTFDAEGQRILRSGTLEHVQITPNPRNNTILVSSPAENLDLIVELIRQLDSPAVQVLIKVFRIVNGDAGSLVATLRSLIPSQPGTAGGPQLSSAPGESSLAPLRFSVDVRSNSIIATGSEGDLRIVEALLIKLDQSASLQRKTVVYQLKNSPAVHIAAAVNEFLLHRRRLEDTAPGVGNPFQDVEREVVVVPEPVANKLILTATPRYFDELSELIEKLDEQPPQVVIQVLIAEVALSDTDEFGVELGLQDSVLFDRGLLGDLLTTTNSEQSSTASGIITSTQQMIQSATNLPGFAFNSTQPLGNSGSDRSLGTADVVGGQGISNFAVGRGNDQLGFGGLVVSASSQHVSILVRALQESRRVDILSRPQIRTLDNQPAFIQVGQRVPRIVGSTVNASGQSNSVTLENVGLILGVTPRISPDGTVVMEIDAEKSSVGPEADGIPVAVSVDGTVIRSPRVDTATAQATVSATSGETIFLGGLITKTTQQIHRRVPYLGDVPLLGHFFRFDSVASRRAELLIILTPHVIRTPEDSEHLRQSEMARMSWCAADVFDLHGDPGLYHTPETEWTDDGQLEIIYPDDNPRGGPMPTPAPIPHKSGVGHSS